MTTSAIEMLNSIINKANLQTHHSVELQGMNCVLCEKSESPEYFVLVFQGETRLKNLVLDKDGLNWKQFRHDLSLKVREFTPNADNICYIYLLDNHSEGIPIQMIEGDRSKGRKYVFFLDEAITFLNGVTRVDQSEVEASDPVKTWASILGSEHLTACMVEPYYKKNLIAYLDGDSFDSPEMLSGTTRSNGTDTVPKVQSIHSISTGDFREFCFARKTLEFGQVNLLFGANGSGKSSVLEGIEYALTADIRRMKDFKIKLTAGRYPQAELVTSNGKHVTFTPDYASKKSKDIERVWYGVPAGRTRTTLNANFSRFNEFDAEAAYKFVHETDCSEESFATTFGNLMFGEEIVDYEKKWQRYKKAYDEIYTEIRDELASARGTIQLYSDILDRRDAESHSEEVEALLKTAGFSKSKDLPTRKTERYEKLVELLAIVKKYIQELTKIWGSRGETFGDIQDYVTLCISREKQALTDRDNTEAALRQFADEITKKKEDLYQLERRIKASDVLVQNYEGKKKQWQTVRRILEDSDSMMMYSKLKDDLKEVETLLSAISTIERYPKVVEYLKNGCPAIMPNDEFEVIYRLVEELKKKKTALEKVYRERKASLNAERAKYAELQRLGKQLARGSQCPLCGHDHNSNEHLLESMSISAVAETELEAIVTQLADLEHEIAEKTIILNEELEKSAAKEELENLWRRSAFLKSYEEDLEGLIAFYFSQDTLTGKKKDIEAQLRVLNNQGINDLSIANGQHFIEQDADYIAYTASMDASFDDYLDRCILACSKERASYSSESAAIKDQMADLEHMVSQQQERLQVVTEAYSRVHKEPYSQISQLLDVIMQSFSLVPSAKISEWVVKFNMLSDAADKEKRRIADESMVEFEKQWLQEAKEKVARLTPQSERCLKAISVFSKMPSLTSFVENSIKKNISIISQYFKWMHHSGEYSSLEVDHTGLYAIRSMNSQIVRPYEMSTGQRSAIAMSVMLALYSAAKTAPKFLLFDEPLATMDDIQVMNALDIFKTLAAQGTQIFFTTANDQMVRLFKEAFQGSSLTYKEYYFTKRINGASLIQERHIHDPLPTEELS